MIELATAQRETLRAWLKPERPGPLVGPHVLNTGHGRVFVDGWPGARAVLAEAADNFALRGDPNRLAPDDLRDVVRGFVEAEAAWLPRLRAIDQDLIEWPRVVYALDAPRRVRGPRRAQVRPLQASDAAALAGLSPETAWVCKTWGGAAGMAASGRAWGAWLDGRLASVACVFFQGDEYEDLGVATEPADRGLGLCTACAAKLCADVVRRGRRPSWNTSLDNRASQRVAEKLGFQRVREDCLYVVAMAAEWNGAQFA
ncbi:MAG: GNAT family N-acetyltransferase [Anaerolineales bacterium]|nr:GNAT family N-acetyltransferase [Anaerolineales bacterium]